MGETRNFSGLMSLWEWLAVGGASSYHFGSDTSSDKRAQLCEQWSRAVHFLSVLPFNLHTTGENHAHHFYCSHCG
jgi:hypothetical protein